MRKHFTSNNFFLSRKKKINMETNDQNEKDTGTDKIIE